MARFELKLPKMGESVAEATITSWLKEVGDSIELDEAILEIATDKVDSEVPSEVEGVLVEILFEKDSVVQVGETIAIIETEGEATADHTLVAEETADDEVLSISEEVTELEQTVATAKETVSQPIAKTSVSGKFYSPLVRNIAQTEGVSMEELERIQGSGKDGRVTKDDILLYIAQRSKALQTTSKPPVIPVQNEVEVVANASPISVNGEDEIVEMSRMGKLVSKHMVNSVQTSAHVQ
ncbi:MAG: E3 binding domain-containing protein, partial [Flavobacteriales bacterium]|nr:E3 binding domain-containing protein [Flavobacteriales bacterium]